MKPCQLPAVLLLFHFCHGSHGATIKENEEAASAIVTGQAIPETTSSNYTAPSTAGVESTMDVLHKESTLKEAVFATSSVASNSTTSSSTTQPTTELDTPTTKTPSPLMTSTPSTRDATRSSSFAPNTENGLVPDLSVSFYEDENGLPTYRVIEGKQGAKTTVITVARPEGNELNNHDSHTQEVKVNKMTIPEEVAGFGLGDVVQLLGKKVQEGYGQVRTQIKSSSVEKYDSRKEEFNDKVEDYIEAVYYSPTEKPLVTAMPSSQGTNEPRGFEILAMLTLILHVAQM